MSTLPAGPRTALAVMFQYFRDPIGCMLPLVRRYGHRFTVPGKPPMVFVGDPDGIKAVYTADPDTFEPLRQDFGELLVGRSVILQKGAEHRSRRKLMGPAFQGQRMRAFGAAMRRSAERRTAGWATGSKVTVLDATQRISLDAILSAVFGVAEPARMERLGELLLDMTSRISPLIMVRFLRHEFGGFGPWARFVARRRALYEEIDALVAEARARGPGDDVLSALVHARDDEGQPLSDEELRDQLVLLVLAGHETTAVALAWAVYALNRPENAAALARLQAELDPLGDEPDAETLARLPWLDAVVQETLRRFPGAPAPSPRLLLRPLDLGGGQVLPAGTSVAVGIGMVHFRDDLYPEPMAFKPERFLERKFSPFELVPFGGGARRCLGAPMAIYEMKIVLASLVRRFQLRLVSDKPERGAVRGPNVGPKSGIRVVVEARRS